jgi:hypothetical protein
VDLVNGSGDQALADDVAARLTAAGLTIGAVTDADAGAAVSGIEYPEPKRSGAEWLADALAAADLLRVADVRHVTVVLGAGDSATLVQAVDALPACG